MKQPHTGAWRRAAAAVAVALCGVLIAEPATAAPQHVLDARPLEGVDARGAALLLSGERGGDLGGAVVWTVARPAKPGERVPVEILLELEGRGLVKEGSRSPVTVDIYGYLLDETGTVVDHLAQELRIDDPAVVATVADDGLVFVGEMTAGAGRHSIRLAARSRATDKFFLDAREIVVPGDAGGAPVVLPPLVSAAGRDVVARPVGTDLRRLVERTPALTPWPSAEPVLAPAAPVEVAVVHTGLTAGQSVALILDGPESGPQGIYEVAAGPSDTGLDEMLVSRVAFPVPEVVPGEYTLRAVFRDSGGVTLASSGAPVLVHPDAADMAWDDPEAPRRASSGPLPLAPQQSADSTMPVNQTVIDEAEPLEEDEPIVEATVEETLCLDVEPGPEVVEAWALRGVEARAVALLMSGQSGGQVAGEVVWTSLGAAGDAEAVDLPLIVEVDGRQLLAGSVGLPVVVEIYGYVLDGSGNPIAHLAEGLVLDDCGLVARLRQSGLKFIGRLSAGPGPYSFRVVVRNRDTHRFFLARRDMEVPAAGSERPFVLPPLIADPSPGWLVAGEEGLDLEDLRLRLPGLQSWPSALPTWPARQPLDMTVGVLGPTASRELAAQLVDAEGMPMPELDLTMGDDAVDVGGLEVRSASIAAPDLPPGTYRLKMVLSDRDSGESTVRSLPVLIYDGTEPLSWTDPDAPRDAGAAQLPIRAERATIADVGDSVLRAAYLKALRLWAARDVVAARRELAEFERQAAGPPGAGGWKRLFNIESLTVRDLGIREPASLMAIAVLHLDMHAWYSARREGDLAEHSWQMASAIARAVQGMESWQPPDGFGECVLLDIASRLAAQGLWGGTKRALEMALDLAPDSAPALLGLGALHERLGDLEGARRPLQKLVRAHPGDLEGRLRLAVNRARTGAENDAEELFRGLLVPPTPEWIRVLAYQELAELLVGEGRAAEAVSLLEEGASRIPGNQRLPILLVHAYDLAGRSRESAAATERLGLAVSQQSTSPRYLYSRFPDLDSNRVRATLAAAEEAGRAVLQEALQEAPEEAQQ